MSTSCAQPAGKSPRGSRSLPKLKMRLYASQRAQIDARNSRQRLVLVRNHGYCDDGKRVGFLAVKFLGVNGHDFSATKIGAEIGG
jgi:hypothetical protein